MKTRFYFRLALIALAILIPAVLVRAQSAPFRWHRHSGLCRRALDRSIWQRQECLCNQAASATPAAPESQNAADAKPDDPFAGVTAKPSPQTEAEQPARSWTQKFFGENFGFRKEIFLQVDTSQDGDVASRQSVGFEALKKFSTETATVASFDFQARLVRRDNYIPAIDDMDGQLRPGWAFEYHNLYLDLYNVLNPVLGDAQRGKVIGRFNFRAGHFYVPFGLNLQTDTHGTVLQLSNERNFGFERDWYTGFWGAINKSLNYDVYYLAGSGYDLKFKGQSGLGALRISLANKYSSQYGLEGGISILGGGRLSPGIADMERSQNAAANVDANWSTNPGGFAPNSTIQTLRFGLDGRYRKPVPTGLLTLTSELSRGRDNSSAVSMQLYQAEYLRASRRWGFTTQYRRFGQEELGAESSIIGEIAWYFRNDVANSNVHSIRLNVERQLERITGRPGVVVTLQYYMYR